MEKESIFLSSTDFFGIVGFIIAWILLEPNLFVFVGIVVAIYYFIRIFLERKIYKRIIFGVLMIICIVMSVFILVDQKSLVRIEVREKINKQYFTEDEVYVSDLIVTAFKKNGKEMQVENFTLNSSKLKNGKNIIQVEYKGLESQITIEAIDPYIEYIEITAVKTDFYVGDKITKKDFSVIGTDSKGKKSVLIDYMISNDEILSEGENTFVFTYGVATAEIKIMAKKHKIVCIEADYNKKAPLYEGDKVAKTDFTVVGVYDNQQREIISDFGIANTLCVRIVVSEE